MGFMNKLHTNTKLKHFKVNHKPMANCFWSTINSINIKGNLCLDVVNLSSLLLKERLLLFNTALLNVVGQHN